MLADAEGHAVKITRADMARIGALLPESLSFFWDNGSIPGLFVVSNPHCAVTVAADDWQRAVCPGSYLSLNQMPFSLRLALPAGRGWHAAAAKHIQALLPQEPAQL